MDDAAVLRVRVQVSDLAAAMAQVQAFDAEMRRAGASSDQLGTSTKQAGGGAKSFASDLQKARDQAANMAKEADNAGRGARKMGDDIEGARRKVSSLEADTKKATGGLSGLLAGFGGAGFGASDLSTSLGPLRGGFSALAGTFVVLGPLLLATGGALFSVGAALAPLVGLAGAAAVGLSALAQAGGVVKLATSGISAALKEQTTNTQAAGGAAVSSAQQQRSAAQQVQSALDGVRTAHEQVLTATQQLQQAEQQETAAQQAVTQARAAAIRSLQDLGSSLEHAKTSEQDAKFALDDARDSLAALKAGASQQQIVEGAQQATDAIHTQQAAVLALTDAQTAYQTLINGPDPQTIAEAQHAVTDAQTGQETAAVNLTKAQQNYATVTANATSTDVDRADALAQLHSAQNAVTDSQDRALDSQAALAKLQAGPSDQDKAKALLAVQQAQDQVTDSTNGAADAQTAYQKLTTPASQEDLAKALLAVREAQDQVADATRTRTRDQHDFNAAEKAGINGSQQVVQADQAVKQAGQQITNARRALADADTGVVRAEQQLRDAHLNAADGATKGAISAGKLNKAMDALPPAAQAFVRELVGMKPKLDELRQTAAAGLFPGVSAGLKDALGSFNPVKQVVGETAGTLGDLAKRAGELVGSKAFGKDIQTVGDSNATIVSRLGRAALYVADALRNVIVAASPLARSLATMALDWAKQTDAATKAGRESGKLGDFFDKTRSVFRTVISIAANLASAFYNVGKAAAPFGGDILQSIDKLTGKFADWTKSIGGQHTLQDFFKESKDLAGQLFKALGSVSGSLGGMAFKVMPAYLKILNALGPAAGPLLQAFVIWKVAMTTLTAVTKTFTVVQAALDLVLDANPVVLIVLALVALAAAIVVAYQKIKPFRDAVNAVWDAIQTGASTVIAWVKANWPIIATLLLGPFGLAVSEIVKHWTTIKQDASDAWDAIKTFIGDHWKLITGLLVGPIGLAVAEVATHWGTIKQDASEAWTAIKTGVSSAWGTVSDSITGAVSGAIDKVKSLIGHGGKDPQGLVGWLAGAWDGITTGISSFAGDVVKAITGVFKGAVNIVIGFINDIIKAIDLIPGVNIKLIPKLGSGSGGGANAQDLHNAGFARGGAYARTGGLINQPMTFMGEEAPLHPEYIIPTNPAYRDRAVGLLGQAAKSLGFAQGGVYSQSEMASLWANVNPGNGDPQVMAAIGEAESGGRAFIVNSIGATGLWQIHPGGSQYLDPVTNARAAGAKLRTQGLGAWEAYTGPDGVGSDGPWRQFYHGGGGGSVVGAIAQGVAGALLGPLGGLVGAGLSAKDVITKLPGVGGLPGWLQGAGKYALDKAKAWIGGRFAGSGSSSGGGPAGLGVFDGRQVAKWIIPELQYGRGHGWTGPITSGYRSEQQSAALGFPHDEHTYPGPYPHGAVDFGGMIDPVGAANRAAFEHAARGYKGLRLLDPIGFRDDGHMSGTGHYKGGMWGGVLGSYESGTPYVPQTGPYLLHQGERVTPAGQGSGPLVHIEHAEFKDEQDATTFARTLGWKLKG